MSVSIEKVDKGEVRAFLNTFSSFAVYSSELNQLCAYGFAGLLLEAEPPAAPDDPAIDPELIAALPPPPEPELLPDRLL